MCSLLFPFAGSWSMVATLASNTICSLCGKSGTTNTCHCNFHVDARSLLSSSLFVGGGLRPLESTWETCHAEFFAEGASSYQLLSFSISKCILQINPPFICLIFQASEKSAQAKKWAEPRIETAKTVVSHYSLGPYMLVLLFVLIYLALLTVC